MSAGRLVHKHTGDQVNIGDIVMGRDGDELTVMGWRKPHKISSSGRIFVKGDNDKFEQQFFPHVFDLKIVDFD